MASDPTLEVYEFMAALRPRAPIVGLDLGTKTIGIALSDITLSIASALETIRRKKFAADADRLDEIVTTHDVVGIVIGLPINLNGTEGPRAQSTRAFARNLAGRTDLPMMFWDERLSTAAAERTLLEADASRKRRGEVIDKMAAAFILQGALDRMSHIRNEN